MSASVNWVLRKAFGVSLCLFRPEQSSPTLTQQQCHIRYWVALFRTRPQSIPQTWSWNAILTIVTWIQHRSKLKIPSLFRWYWSKWFRCILQQISCKWNELIHQFSVCLSYGILQKVLNQIPDLSSYTYPALPHKIYPASLALQWFLTVKYHFRNYWMTALS